MKNAHRPAGLRGRKELTAISSLTSHESPATCPLDFEPRVRCCHELSSASGWQADYEAKLARQRRRLDQTARQQELLDAQAKRLAAVRLEIDAEAADCKRLRHTLGLAAQHARDVAAGVRAR